MKKENIIPYWLYLIIAGTIIIPIVAYFLQFHSGFGNQFHFGAFGDFINPFLALINIFLLIFLSYIVEKNNRTKHNEAIKTQEKLNTLSLRFEAYNTISPILDLKGSEKREAEDYPPDFPKVEEFLNTVIENYQFLFPFLQNDSVCLSEITKSLISLKNIFQGQHISKKDEDINSWKNCVNIEYKKYNEWKRDFKKEFQKCVMGY